MFIKAAQLLDGMEGQERSGFKNLHRFLIPKSCKFLDGMEGQERSGFKDLHRFLDRLPLPVAKDDCALLHSEALQGGFIPKMDAEEQKRFTPSELLL